MKVKLSSVGNPDFGQNPNQRLYGSEKNKVVTVTSFKEASDVCRDFIDNNDLGSGNWSGGEILDENNKIIAHVSYNGRVWEGRIGDWNGNTKQIEIKP